MVNGRIENYLKSELKRKKALIFILIDSEVSQNSQAITLAKKEEEVMDVIYRLVRQSCEL